MSAAATATATAPAAPPGDLKQPVGPAPPPLMPVAATRSMQLRAFKPTYPPVSADAEPNPTAAVSAAAVAAATVEVDENTGARCPRCGRVFAFSEIAAHALAEERRLQGEAVARWSTRLPAATIALLLAPATMNGSTGANEVVPGLWLGSQQPSADAKWLTAHGITHVLDCFGGPLRRDALRSLYHQLNITSLHAPLHDTSAFPIADHLPTLCGFVNAALAPAALASAAVTPVPATPSPSATPAPASAASAAATPDLSPTSPTSPEAAIQLAAARAAVVSDAAAVQPKPAQANAYAQPHATSAATASVIAASAAAASAAATVAAAQRPAAVLVHCAAGVSRSATVVTAYLMQYAVPRMTLAAALAVVRKARSFAYPNRGFMRALMALDMQLYGVHSIPPDALELHTEGSGISKAD